MLYLLHGLTWKQVSSSEALSHERRCYNGIRKRNIVQAEDYIPPSPACETMSRNMNKTAASQSHLENKADTGGLGHEGIGSRSSNLGAVREVAVVEYA